MKVRFRLLVYSDWWVKLQYKPFLFWRDVWCVSELAYFLRDREYKWEEQLLQWQGLRLLYHSKPMIWSNSYEVCKELVRYVEEIWNKKLEWDKETEKELKERKRIISEIYS